MRRSRWTRAGVRTVSLLVAMHVAGCGGHAAPNGEDGENTGGSSGTGTGGTGTGATSGTSSLGGTMSSGGTAGTSAGGTSGTGASCNDLVPSTNPVSFLADTATAPAPAGGTLLPGLYHLESITFYGEEGAECVTMYEELGLTYSLRVSPAFPSSGVFQMVVAASGTEIRTTMDYTVEGVNLVTTLTCGEGSTTPAPYSAEPTSLVLFVAATGSCGSRADVLRLE